MPHTSDRQPLLPPALRRLQRQELNKLTLESGVTPPPLPSPQTAEAAKRDNSSGGPSEEDLETAEAQSEAAKCDGGASIHGHPISRLILLNHRSGSPGRKHRQSKSTVPGVMSQFSQLHSRRSLLHRLTLSVAGIFGRMCARRRDVAISPEVEDKDTGSQGAGHGTGVTNKVATSTNSSSSLDAEIDRRSRSRSSSPAKEYFLQDTDERISDIPTPRLERMFSHTFDIDLDLHSDGEDFEEVDITHDPGGEDTSRDPSPEVEGDSAAQGFDDKTELNPDTPKSRPSPVSAHRPRQRWTFLSALRLLPLPRSRSVLHTPLRESEEELEPSDGETCPEHDVKMKLELDLTGDHHVTTCK